MRIRIGNQEIGSGKPVFIVAEMSGNHGGSLKKAKEIVRAAKRAGADAIKLQTYTADTITLRCDLPDFLLSSDSPWSAHRSLWDLYNEAHTPWEWHAELFSLSRELGLEIFSSPFDETAVDFLEKLDVAAYKIASPEINHIPLLEKVAKTGKPIILSTGISELADIVEAMEVLKSSGAKEIIVLKCTSTYPAPANEANLRTITEIQSRFGVLPGLSDHTEGEVSALIAVALGASVIEKHFMLDDSSSTVDSFFSLGESRFARLVENIRLAEQSLGQVSYEITPSAQQSVKGRRSIYVSALIKKGDVLTRNNIKVVRPSFGLHPRHFSEVLGRCVRRDVLAGERLSWDVIE